MCIYVMNVYMCEYTYTWGCTCTGVQVCRGQRLTSGMFFYCSLPWVPRQDLLLPIQLAQGIPSLSLGDRITEKVPHFVFMLVLESELWFSHLHAKCFMYWAISLHCFSLLFCWESIDSMYVLGCFWLLWHRASNSPVSVDNFDSTTR